MKVTFDRADGDRQRCRDLLIGKTLVDETKHDCFGSSQGIRARIEVKIVHQTPPEPGQTSRVRLFAHNQRLPRGLNLTRAIRHHSQSRWSAPLPTTARLLIFDFMRLQEFSNGRLAREKKAAPVVESRPDAIQRKPRSRAFATAAVRLRTLSLRKILCKCPFVVPTVIVYLASGGVSKLDDLDETRKSGAFAVIIGKAIYEKVFTVAEAIERAFVRGL